MPKDRQSQGPIPQGRIQRPYNERLFLDLIRHNGAMSKADLTRASGLSAQSATVIVNRLVEDGLLRAGASVKGRIGQPSTPYSLDPDGVLSIGIKVGRRSLEVASMGFDYAIIGQRVQRYDFPHLPTIRQSIARDVALVLADLTQAQRARICGIGIALPDELQAWEATVGAPEGAMADWAEADLAVELRDMFDLPVTTLNDASAACLAEIALGNSHGHACFAYFYVGTFIGGGIAIGHKLYTGQRNLAGAIASIPVGATATGKAAQLLEGASLHYLEESAEAAGLVSDIFYNDHARDATAQAVFDDWLRVAAPQIAFAAVTAQAFLDPDAIVVDSSLSRDLTTDLVAAVTRAAHAHYDHRGLSGMVIVPGEIGLSARAIGSGIAPILVEYALDEI
ncbi:ROK family protein [Rhodobacterales bacterium LSUCC0031]|nr:ROK family protein [Rhodobacterales bacterium LSUCC0031]